MLRNQYVVTDIGNLVRGHVFIDEYSDVYAVLDVRKHRDFNTVLVLALSGEDRGEITSRDFRWGEPVCMVLL